MKLVGPRTIRKGSSLRDDERFDLELRQVFDHAYDPAVRKLPCLDIGRAYWGAKAEFPYGGDVVDVFRYRDGRTSIAVIDISGHGISSARQAGLLRHALRAYASQGFDAVGSIRALNRLCIEEFNFEDDSEFFATAFFGIIAADCRSIAYVSAGHEAACLVRCGIHRFLDVTGPILGLLDDDRAFRGETLALEPGDVVAAVTASPKPATSSSSFSGPRRLRRSSSAVTAARPTNELRTSWRGLSSTRNAAARRRRGRSSQR